MRRRRFRSPLAPRSLRSGTTQRGLLLLGGLLVGVLALLLKDFVRESILVPLAYTVSGARVALNVLPQVVWWLAFLLVTLFIVVGAVLVALPASRQSGASDEPRPGRVETWMRWIDLAAGGGDNYSRQNLARRVRDLALGALAVRDNLTLAEVESRLLKPPDVESQLDILLELDSARDPSASLTAGLVDDGGDRSRARARSSEIDIERIVRYLEDELEVPRGG